MKLKLHLTLIATAILSGCGSDDDGPDPVNESTVPLAEYGVIRVAHNPVTAQTQVEAVFCELETPTAAATIDEQFLTGIDSCTVSNDGATTNDIAPLVCSTELPALTISAGSNLTLSSDAGTFADVEQQQNGEIISYASTSPLPRPPNGLTADIPGDTFPTFTALAIPDLQDLVINSPAAGEVLLSDTTITWNAATDRTNSRVLLTASDAGVTVNCSLADDGSHTFSAATQAQLGELFGTASISARRQNLTSPTRGDSGFVIITSIQEPASR